MAKKQNTSIQMIADFNGDISELLNVKVEGDCPILARAIWCSSPYPHTYPHRTKAEPQSHQFDFEETIDHLRCVLPKKSGC